MCTTLTNNYLINTPRTPCNGTYSGVLVYDEITIENGKVVTLTNCAVNYMGKITVKSGGKLTLSTTDPIQTVIDVEGTGELTLNCDLVAYSDINIGNGGKLTVNGDCTVDGYSNFAANSTINISGKLTVSGLASYSGTVINANDLKFQGGCTGCYPVAGKITISGTTEFPTGCNNIVIDCCKLETYDLSYATGANEISGSGYIKINNSASGNSNNITSDSNLRIYNGGSNTNCPFGSATVLGSPISPSPC